MAYSPATYARAISELERTKKLTRSSSRRFFEIVRKNGHVHWLPEILERVHELSYASRGIKRIEVVAARTEEKKFIPGIRRAFGGKSEVVFRVKPEIIGGVVLKMNGTTVIDASVKRQLDRMFTKN